MYLLSSDVGANTGQSAERYRASYPNARIFCFEPVSTTYQELKRRTAALKQVKTYQLAFGDMLERKDIYVHPSLSATGHSFVNACDHAQQETVDVQTLDEFCLENNISNIDLLKIDVEGYEMEVLSGAKRMLTGHRIASLYLETTVRFNSNYDFVPLTKLDNLLASLGYSNFGIYEQRTDELRHDNSLYFFNVAYVDQKLCKQQHEI